MTSLRRRFYVDLDGRNYDVTLEGPLTSKGYPTRGRHNMGRLFDGLASSLSDETLQRQCDVLLMSYLRLIDV